MSEKTHIPDPYRLRALCGQYVARYTQGEPTCKRCKVKLKQKDPIVHYQSTPRPLYALCGRKGVLLTRDHNKVTCQRCKVCEDRPERGEPKTHAAGPDNRAMCGWLPSVYAYEWSSEPTCKRCREQLANGRKFATPTHIKTATGALCGTRYGEHATPKFTTSELEPPTCERCRYLAIDLYGDLNGATPGEKRLLRVTDARWQALRLAKLASDRSAREPDQEALHAELDRLRRAR